MDGNTITLEVVLRCEDDAFQPDPVPEVQRILSVISKRLPELGRDHAGECWQTIHDVNGNDVGRFRFGTRKARGW